LVHCQTGDTAASDRRMRLPPALAETTRASARCTKHLLRSSPQLSRRPGPQCCRRRTARRRLRVLRAGELSTSGTAGASRSLRGLRSAQVRSGAVESRLLQRRRVEPSPCSTNTTPLWTSTPSPSPGGDELDLYRRPSSRSASRLRETSRVSLRSTCACAGYVYTQAVLELGGGWGRSTRECGCGASRPSIRIPSEGLRRRGGGSPRQRTVGAVVPSCSLCALWAGVHIRGRARGRRGVR
jgi:hypothetical protein